MKIKFKDLLLNKKQFKKYNCIILPIDFSQESEVIFTNEIKDGFIINMNVFNSLLKFYELTEPFQQDNYLKYIEYFCKELKFYPTDFIMNLRYENLINLLNVLSEEIEVFIENHKNINSKLKLVWMPWDDELRQPKALNIGNNYKEQGYKNFNNIGIIKEWKEGIIEDINEINIPINDEILAYSLLYFNIHEHTPNEYVIKELIEEIKTKEPEQMINSKFWQKGFDYGVE